MTTTATATTTTTWIRFGALPKTIAPQDWHPWDMINLRSRNHAEGGYEAGVSVYPGHVEGTKVYVDLTGIGAGSALFILDPDDVWQVTGRRVTADDYWDQTVDAYSDGVELDHDPVGSDGEPLIWVHYDDRDFAARRVRCTELWVKLTTNGEWILTAEIATDEDERWHPSEPASCWGAGSESRDPAGMTGPGFRAVRRC